MNALVDPAGSGRGLLLEKLMAAVRPEFRMPLYVPVPGDPALGGAECAVGLTGQHIVIRDGKAVITDTAA